MSKSNYSTVIITDKNSHETKVYSIKQKHIENIVLYKRILLFSTVCIVILLAGLSSYIGYVYYQKRELRNRILSLQNKLNDKQLDNLLNNLSEAGETLDLIEKYLKEREVKTLSSSRTPEEDNKDVGGEYCAVDNMNADAINLQTKRIHSLLENIQSIPMGLPHIGRLSSDFGVRGNPMSGRGAEFHPGLDLAGKIGAPIKVTANGVVTYAGVRGGYGNCIIVKHSHGYETLYGHLSEIDVTMGQKVKSGDVIGKLGNTGRSTGPHVHYEIIRNNEKINPKEFLKLK